MPDIRFSIMKWLAAGLGSGWLPKASGTWGSLASLLPAWLILNQAGVGGLWLATLFVTLLGFAVCAQVLPRLVAQGQDHDPGWIVIDEWAGQWLCISILLTPFPETALTIVLPLAFILFRGFDIIKPFPIKIIETKGPDWFSIMNDDLAAGIIGSGIGLIILLAIS